MSKAMPLSVSVTFDNSAEHDPISTVLYVIKQTMEVPIGIAPGRNATASQVAERIERIDNDDIRSKVDAVRANHGVDSVTLIELPRE